MDSLLGSLAHQAQAASSFIQQCECWQEFLERIISAATAVRKLANVFSGSHFGLTGLNYLVVEIPVLVIWMQIHKQVADIVLMCPDRSGKKPHRQVGVGRVVISERLGG